MTARMKRVLGVLLGVYLLGFGILAGVAIDRMRFDGQRSDVLGRYEQKLREWQAHRMALETAAGERR